MENITEELTLVTGKAYILREDAVMEEIEEKNNILAYFKSVQPIAIAPAYLWDFVKNVKTDQSIYLYEDGDYRWTSADVYYFEKYNIKLKDEFIKSISK